MLSRGNATSGAPICNGMSQFAKPEKTGVANISSMIVPCIVNAWLYCSFERIWVPGRASSARSTRAINPPMRKNANDVTRYSDPIVLWSVVVNHFTTDFPGAGRGVSTFSRYAVAMCPVIFHWDPTLRFRLRARQFTPVRGRSSSPHGAGRIMVVCIAVCVPERQTVCLRGMKGVAGRMAGRI